MKVKVISRSEEEMTRERPRDLMKVHRNLDPTIHPFEKAREYTRALNATKLDKVFAKPFLWSMNGHMDGVYTMAKSPTSLVCLASGACDGEIRVWNTAHNKCIWSSNAHKGFVRGLVIGPSGDRMLSCGQDKTIKLWDVSYFNDEDDAVVEDAEEPLQSYLGKSSFTSISHHWSAQKFATTGTALEIWDHERSDPLHSFQWGVDAVIYCKFNHVEKDVVASLASDRSIILYDLRGATPIRKMVMAMRSNALAWNPMEAFNFTVANEDHNLYTYDMRKLDKALNVHKDHVGAVLDVDYSPSGREFVSGSYDRTLRIFKISDGHSREVYHTKRMQRIFSVRFSADTRYVYSGSDDTNIRVWKSNSSAMHHQLLPRERAKVQYQEKIKEKFKHVPEVKRIAKHRHLPKVIHKAQNTLRTMKNAKLRREENARRNSGTPKKVVPERKRKIVRQFE